MYRARESDIYTQRERESESMCVRERERKREEKGGKKEDYK